MSESRLKHLGDEEYSSRIVEHSLIAGPLTSEHSLTAGPLTSHQSLLVETLSTFLYSFRYHFFLQSRWMQPTIIPNHFTASAKLHNS